MGKRLPHTPNSKIRAALRQLWLRSRERNAAIKRTGNRCQMCGIKATLAKGREVKLEVHHVEGVLNWEELFAAVRRHLLVHPDKQMPLCKSCHDKQHHFPANGSPESKNKKG
jgi:predicted HNH restriction endonuclease